MAPGVEVDVLASRFRFAVEGADAERLRAQWSRCLAPTDDADTSAVEIALSTDADPDRRDYALASAVTLAGISAAAGSRLMLHAAGVADTDTGATAVLVAASGTGKTTAASRLCAVAGFGYVTDETVSIGPDLQVLPYPKPLSLVIDPAEPWHKSQHGPDELQLLPCPPYPRARRIFLLDRDPAHSAQPQTDPVDLLDGLLELIPQTSALPAMTDPLFTLGRAVSRLGGVWRLQYREIQDAAALLTEALRAPLPQQPVVQHFPPPPGMAGHDPYARHPEPASDAPADELPDTVVRAPFTDAIGVEGEVLVLIGATPLRLSGLGATVWREAATAQSLAALQAVCVVEHGDHPEAEQLVRDAVRVLVHHGLLLDASAA